MKLSRITSWFPVALMAVLAILVYWLADVIRSSAERPATIDHEPDYIVEQFQVRQFNETGFLSNILHGQTITHYADDKTAQIVEPIILHRAQEGKPAYRATASLGLTDENLREVVLDGDVKIVRQPVDGPSATLLTNQIRYNDKIGLASTEYPVTVVSGNNRIFGQKLSVDTINNTVTLEGQVTATYSPNSVRIEKE